MTALGQPKLLERVSASLVAIHNLFRTFDADLNGVITRDEFEKVLPDCPLSDCGLRSMGSAQR